MEANEFVAKLKANGSKNDICDLEKVYSGFKKISSDLPCKDKGSFAVNVLCTLCRNLDKVPGWCSSINTKDLVVLSVDCVRDTRTLGQTDRVKVLACVFHIHRHVVRQDTPIPPELVLKLSYMPFESDATNLLTEYAKTYWNILADRISYIEKLKSRKLAIIKLLAKLTEDVDKVIELYDTVQFCNNILTFLIKKMFFLYNDFYAKHLNAAYKSIFQAVSSKKDLKNFKSLTEKDVLSLYGKLNDAFYVIVENSSKTNFKQSILNDVVQTFLSLIGHRPDVFHCIQAFHLHAFCAMFTDKPNCTFTENILRNLLLSCETTEIMRCKNAMVCSYPYIYQLVRLYIEYCATNCDKIHWQDMFTVVSQECCLKLILLLMKRMKTLEQLLKCDNCNIKSGLHDSLRLSFSAKHFIVVSINKSMDIKSILPLYFTLIQEQYDIMTELNVLGCSNYEKCFKKAQTDIHNTAILLNKAGYYEFSINTFNVYLKNEIRCCKLEADRKNISRAFYNKAICELDFKLYENALQSAYLSFLFAQPVGMNSEKYISLVIDIKAKIIKNRPAETEDEAQQITPDTLQLVTVLDVCQMATDTDHFGDLKQFFKDLNFSQLLKHEFSMYAKLWPSVVPIAGVWIALLKISENSTETLSNRTEANNILQEIIIETPTAVRTIHSEYFTKIIKKISSEFLPNNVKEKLVLSTILLLKCEYDLAEASEKYGWKGTEQTDADVTSTRTIAQEHTALADGVKAVELMTEVLPELKKLPLSPYLCHVLAVSQVFVPQLLLYHRPAHALQLAHICCEMADLVGDPESYVRNAGVLLYHAGSPHSQVVALCKMAAQRAEELRKCGAEDTALGFYCDAAIFYTRCGMKAAAAELVQYVQAAILEASENEQNLNLDLAIGRLLEAQTMLCQDTGGPTLLTAVFGTQRHYSTVPNNWQKYSSRRLMSLTTRERVASATRRCAHAARALLLWRRARVTTAAASAAYAHAHAAVCSFDTHHAQVVIDNCLKHALGLPTNESLNTNTNEPTFKHTHTFTPKRELLEPMRDSQMFNKNPTSPTLACLTVPGFHMPEFCTHVANCKCYACETPASFILACQTAGLEASVYFRAKEFDLAKNYYDGVLKMFGYVESKLVHAKRSYENINFEKCVVDIVDGMYKTDFKYAQIGILIEASFFELAQKNYEKADDFIVRIHEVMQEIDQESPYVRAEVYNLMCASAQLRKVVKRATGEIALEKELENLKLSPDKPLNPPKTPEEKVPMPKFPKMVVKDEELPNTKRKVIKLNLDEVPDEPKATKRTSKRSEFKIPVPITSRAIPENITPRPSRKPVLLLTQPSLEIKETIQTPVQNDSKVEFFTPVETPSEQFFTPVTSIKTYSKNSLRQNIVKNLEHEFSTTQSAQESEDKVKIPRKSLLAVPKKIKAKVETGSIRTLKDKRTELKRVTSPGKLKDEKKISPTKTRRQLRKPVKFSLDGDEKLPRN